MNKSTLKVILVFSLLCLIWGSTWLAIRESLDSLTPLFSAAIRFSLASLLIFVIMRVRNIRIQTDKISIRIYIAQGFFAFAIPYALVYWSEQFVPSGLAAVLFGVYPFCVALFSYFAIPNEKIGPYKITGMVLGFVGIVIIFGGDTGGDLTSYVLGMIAMVCSAIFQAGAVVTVKKYGHHLNPLSMNLIPMFMAAVVLFIFAFMFEKPSALVFDEKAVIPVLYLALFGSVITFTGYYWLMKRLNVVILSLMAFITPIVALILGWIVLNEKLSSNDLTGCIFVLAGLIIANVKGLSKLKKEKIIKETV